ncbi:MAG TPA: hypothetical protein VGL00_07325, partial [Terracidiphilus sp.]
INYHAAITPSEPGSAVAAAAHRYRQMLPLSEVESAGDVCRRRRTYNHCRALIECTVEDHAG